MLKKVLTIVLVYFPAGFVVGSVLLVTLLKWVPVTWTPLMAKRELEAKYSQVVSGKGSGRLEVVGSKKGSGGSEVVGCRKGSGGSGGRRQEWVALGDVSEEMVRCAIVAEDSRFLEHRGIDFEELRLMRQANMCNESPIRGCSTISQQTAKNCFTWCTHSWLRKGMEAYWTALIEMIWGKRRILEVYLNIAEMGPGIYGVEAASRHYFDISAAELTMADASSLVCCLPNPLHRDPDWVNHNLGSRRDAIARAASQHKALPGPFAT